MIMAFSEKIWVSYSKQDKLKCSENNYSCIEWGTYSAIMTKNGTKYYCGCGQE